MTQVLLTEVKKASKQYSKYPYLFSNTTLASADIKVVHFSSSAFCNGIIGPETSTYFSPKINARKIYQIYKEIFTVFI